MSRWQNKVSSRGGSGKDKHFRRHEILSSWLKPYWWMRARLNQTALWGFVIDVDGMRSVEMEVSMLSGYAMLEGSF